MPFRDRADAGRRLAAQLVHLRDEKPVVLALPRGGVPVAYEVARVLKPDGILLYADTMKQGRREGMEQDLRSAGFEAEFRDITSNVAEACRLDSQRRREVIRRHAPVFGRLLLKRQLHNYAAIEGSSKFHAFVEGRRSYLMTAATKG